MTQSIPLIDCHMHVLNRDLAPEAFKAGRFALSRAETRLVDIVIDAVDTIPVDAEIEVIARVVDLVLDRIPAVSVRWKALKTLIKLYCMSTRDYLCHLDALCASEGVYEAAILVPAGPGVGPRAVMRLLDAARAYPRFKVFVPEEYAGFPGVSGIKYYPAMEGFRERVIDTAIRLNLPIISHCSPGGIRNRSESAARAMNAPGRWHDYLKERPIRLLLAHGGGNAKWISWHLHGRDAAGLNWSLDNLLRDACPPSEAPGRLWWDCAYHEGMILDRDRYGLACLRMMPWWALAAVTGSDYPLHLLDYSYSDWADAARVMYGDTGAAWREFLKGGEA